VVVNSLLFVEDRDLLDPHEPQRNPAVRATTGGRPANSMSKTWCRTPVVNRRTAMGAEPTARVAIAAASSGVGSFALTSFVIVHT
jgi:hypothetical protein